MRAEGAGRQLLAEAKLYLILDTEVNNYSELAKIAGEAAAAGVDIFQLRNKSGSAQEALDFIRKVKPIFKGRALFFVNDRADLALACGADGVHLGQTDLPLSAARKILGTEYFIGASCQTLTHITSAESDRADYVGLGSVFKTLTKPGRDPMDSELLKKAAVEANVPLFAIGGVTLDNIGSLLESGIRRVAVCRAVCKSGNVSKTVKEFRRILDSY